MTMLPRKCSDTIGKLEDMGLAAPEMTYIMNGLYARGLPVDLNATTIKEGRDSILKALQLK